ncbi:uncharacterized protein LOC124406541 [Diprion similis]|uniref:uncharacterized protein LOC124406541 n=1 Tax=Diprion similis TaxID=362088 RepID=UPI001EF7D0F4|nr:uncharacterized protein LOC124406541 [Diprion similis]
MYLTFAVTCNISCHFRSIKLLLESTWHFAASMSSLFVVSICCIIYASAVSTSARNTACDKHIMTVLWEKTDPPVAVTQRMNPTVPDQLEVKFENIQEDLNISLLAHPFIDKEADCPADKPNTSLPYLVKYVRGKSVSYKNESRHQYHSYNKIFTGCYYIQLTNKEGKNWMKGPSFYQTAIPYNDTSMMCSNSGFTPEDSESNRAHFVKLRVPLKCLGIKTYLWELTGAVNDSTKEKCPGDPTHSHTFTIEHSEAVFIFFRVHAIVGIKPKPFILKFETRQYKSPNAFDFREMFTSIESDPHNETWTAEIEWVNLKRGGASYCSSYTVIFEDACFINHTHEDLRQWKSAYTLDVIPHVAGFRDSNSTPPEDHQDSSGAVLRIIGYIALGVITILVLPYFIWKWGVIKCAKKSTSHMSSQVRGVTIKLNHVKKSREILLLYAKSSPDFMDKMKTFRDEIQRKCQCHVHDLQSEEDADTIATMGPIGWTEQMLREGSKVIWVDTPQLRSLLKKSKSNEEKEEYARDYRNPAFIFALDHIITVSQNVIAQYQRYFVVRCQEFKVDNDNDDDPLLSVSPQARYPIPERFEDLCKDICDSMPPMK